MLENIVGKLLIIIFPCFGERNANRFVVDQFLDQCLRPVLQAAAREVTFNIIIAVFEEVIDGTHSRWQETLGDALVQEGTDLLATEEEECSSRGAKGQKYKRKNRDRDCAPEGCSRTAEGGQHASAFGSGQFAKNRI